MALVKTKNSISYKMFGKHVKELSPEELLEYNRIMKAKNRAEHPERREKEKEYRKNYRQANPEKIKELAKKYRENNREKIRLYGARYRAKKGIKPFSLCVTRQMAGVSYNKMTPEQKTEYNHLRYLRIVEKRKEKEELLRRQIAELEEQLNSAKVGEEFALKCCNEARELLTEKEKEVESKNFSIKWLEENYNKERHRANEVADTARKHNYDMAIQQLEKVKGSVQAFDGIELIGFIDQQIKQLKEGS